MDLEYPEEFSAAGHDGHSQIAKGKRTKRQRPASPSCGGAASMTSCSSSGGGGGGRGGGGGGEASSALSPSSSGDNVVYSSAEEEEEDLANCLILLAQGDGRPRRVDCDHDGGKMGIFSSKKFSEVVAATAATGVATVRAGFYVYECKTCSRVFPSFQALGGHRASHKKPKSAADPDQKIKPSTVVLGLDAIDDEDEGHSGKINPPVSIHVAGHMAGHKGLHQPSKPKIHECNICGSEFASGQALGGHMRRHRSAAPVTATSANATSPTDPPPVAAIAGSNGEKSRNVLSLDLNLPAPPEEDHHHHQAHRRRETSKFQFAKSQQPIILASPALVDCHY